MCSENIISVSQYGCQEFCFIFVCKDSCMMKWFMVVLLVVKLKKATSYPLVQGSPGNKPISLWFMKWWVMVSWGSCIISLKNSQHHIPWFRGHLAQRNGNKPISLIEIYDEAHKNSGHQLWPDSIHVFQILGPLLFMPSPALHCFYLKAQFRLWKQKIEQKYLR